MHHSTISIELKAEFITAVRFARTIIARIIRQRCRAYRHRFFGLAILGSNTVQFTNFAIGTIDFKSIYAIDISVTVVNGESAAVEVGTGCIGEDVAKTIVSTLVPIGICGMN
jgi:hypothetical protein